MTGFLLTRTFAGFPTVLSEHRTAVRDLLGRIAVGFES
jgi:hypothetical protein